LTAVPKIAADTVAEHIAQQEAAVIAAASRLFAERGVAQVSLATIASEVGLARNSLYRYFPDKGHILAAWFRAELAPLQEASTAIASADQPADERLEAWLGLHLDYLTAPEHQAMMSAATEMPTVTDDVRADIAEGHRNLYATLGIIVEDLLRDTDPPRDSRVVTMLITGLLRSSADLVVGSGADADVVRGELLRTSRAAVV
jgi:AcrR family transcriptional regulator